jgi:hypothetical protein
VPSPIQAAHLVDRVFPSVPLRQWVLSVPFELRLLLAKNHRALSAVGRVFVRELLHWQREQAGLADITCARGGAVCFPQRFGGSLNLNVHYHVAVPDGVFTDGGDRAVFHLRPESASWRPSSTRQTDRSPCVISGLDGVPSGMRSANSDRGRIPAVRDGLPLVRDAETLSGKGFPLVREGLPARSEGHFRVREGHFGARDAFFVSGTVVSATYAARLAIDAVEHGACHSLTR